jgi:RNA polymerase sigma factor (sigma-70 family)
MPDRVPSHLAALLEATSAASRDAAWQRFVDEYSRLILSVARSLGGPYDAVMDRYVFTLDHLKRDEFRKLRGYTSDPRAKFTTWLVVVCRRICLDEHRSKFGRARAGSDVIRLQTRRSLTHSLASALELETLPATDALPDVELETRERSERLERCLSLLAPADRLLIRLRFEDDLSAAQIAKILHLATPFHVYRRLNRLLADLRTALVFGGSAQKDATRPFNLG